jgi:hypothetical protein
MALEDLNQFTGSEEFFRHSINRNLIYTEGVKYVAEGAGAFWLLDAIAIANFIEPTLKDEEFQTWVLTKKGNAATLVADDGNNRVLYTQAIDYTDFPLDSIKFYVVSALDFGNHTKMAMLPSEY